ncbi:MAG: PQQ-binding-like beta-propeller repeat protein [Acidimicrobiales bacterium]|jgi:hypothetical protein
MTSGYHLIRRLATSGALVVAVATAVATGPAAAQATGGSAGALRQGTGPAVVFSQPVGLAVDHGRLWVTNRKADSVMELTANGALVRTLSAGRYGFQSPSAVVADGADVFVANSDDSITEVAASDGSFVRHIRGHAYNLRDPSAMVVYGTHLWVTDSKGNSVTEINDTDGRLIRALANKTSSPRRFDDPDAITRAGSDLWVTNYKGDSVTEIDETSGAVVKTIDSGTGPKSYGLSEPDGIAFDGTNLWVSDSGMDQVTEMDASSGALVQIVTNSSHNGNYGFWSPGVVLAHKSVVYVVSPPGSSPMITQMAVSSGDSNWMMCNTNYAFNFDNPSALALDGSDLWVANEANDTLTEMNASSGVLIQDIT